MRRLVRAGSNENWQKFCFVPGSNRRPCACEAHVITTTLRKLDVLKLPWDVDQYKVHLLNVMLVEDKNMWLLCLKIHCTTIKSSNFWLRPFLRAFRPEISTNCYKFCSMIFSVSSTVLYKTEKMFAQRGARTHDPEIKSLMLYRLS